MIWADSLIKPWIEKLEEGDWNRPWISIDRYDLIYNGYAPIHRGGCIGVIPFGEQYIILTEDDDYYRDKLYLSKNEFDHFVFIMKELVKCYNLYEEVKRNDIALKLLLESVKRKIRPSTGVFMFKLRYRDSSNPLVYLTNAKNKPNLSFDLGWAKEKLSVLLNCKEDISEDIE